MKGTKKMKCLYCGEEYAENFERCPRCGTPKGMLPVQNQQQQGQYNQQGQPWQQGQYQQQPIIIQEKKKRGCFTNFLIFLGASVLIVLFIALIIPKGNTDTKSSNGTTSITQKAETTESTTKKLEKGLYIFDDSQLKFKSYKIVDEDYGDSNYLVVNFEYTNTSDKAISFDWDITTKAFQKGIELQSPISTYGIHDYDFHNTEKEIKPGATIEIKEAYEISNFKDTVTIELYDNMFADEPKYQFDIKPKK